jgi:Sulfotransferase domain
MPPAAPPAAQAPSAPRATPAERAKEVVARLAERNPALYFAKVRWLSRRCDAFLISFPKCGRTWLRVMLGHALARSAGIKVGNPMRFTKGEQIAPGLPRVLATHDDSPQNKDADDVLRTKRAYRSTKVVFLVRDPRDVIVSLYFHVTRRRGKHYEGTLSDFVRDRNGSLASLLAFYDAWVAQDDTPVLLVRYEAIKEDPARELRRVLEFIGQTRIEDGVVTHAVEQASFERLQRAEREGTANTKALKTSSADDPESFKVRRGKVGGYVDYLTAEDIRFVDDAIAASPGARHLGYAGDTSTAG